MTAELANRDTNSKTNYTGRKVSLWYFPSEVELVAQAEKKYILVKRMFNQNFYYRSTEEITPMGEYYLWSTFKDGATIFATLDEVFNLMKEKDWVGFSDLEQPYYYPLELRN